VQVTEGDGYCLGCALINAQIAGQLWLSKNQHGLVATRQKIA